MANAHQANAAIPRPDVMPVDRKSWARKLHLSNFINCHYQYRDPQRLNGVRTVLIVGPGQGLDTHVHRPDGVTARYWQRQRFWEVGFRGFRVRDLKRRFSHSFRIIDAYRNAEWLPSDNFVLAYSRHAP